MAAGVDVVEAGEAVQRLGERVAAQRVQVDALVGGRRQTALLHAGELADALGLTAPAMSRHLRVLKQSGLVEATHPEFDARVRVYALKEAGLTDLRKWLDDMERLWARQLTALKDHIEKGGRK